MLWRLPRSLALYTAALRGDPCLQDRAAWLRRRLRPGPWRTLDAGCGSGAFTMYAASIGNTAIGLSNQARQNGAARRRAMALGLMNVEFRDVDLRRLAAHARELGTFDQVICLETIEHLLDDAGLVRDLAALLRENGVLYLTTPYKHYRRLYGDTLSTTEDGGHVRWGYTHAELRTLLGAHGLLVVRNEYISGIITQQLTNLMRLVGLWNLYAAWALTLPLRLACPLDRPLTRLLRYPYQSVAIVAIKPVAAAGGDRELAWDEPIAAAGD